VREVMRAVEEVTRRAVPHKIGPRREGDPAVLVADSGKLQKTMGWRPRYSELREIVATAWKFAGRRSPTEPRA
jgi:UDP-glucose 4-epimerase